MGIDSANRRLGELHASAKRVAANLVDLELDASRQLLEASSLMGRTAARWSQVSTLMSELWRRHGLLEDLLKHADELRGPRRAGELTEMLDGPSIELATTDVPLAERRLLGSAQEGQWCSPDELLAGMSAAFDEVKAAVVQIGAAWDESIPRLQSARQALEDARRLAAELGGPATRELDPPSRSLEGLGIRVTADPLSVGTGELDALLGQVEAIRADLERTAALKRGFDGRMLAARELLARVRETVETAAAEHEELLRKIAAPATSPPPAVDGELDTALARITGLAAHGSWQQARRELDSWSTRAESLLEQARQARAADRAPLEARNQFRALLEAYQVKAGRLGRIEDPQLTEIFVRAREVLYHAPTDLALGARLVRSYQEALRDPAPTREAIREL